MATRKPGRPAYQPTERDRKQVKTLAGMGVPHEQLCKLIGVSKPTLEKHFRAELDTGLAEANAQVAQSLFKMATDKDRPNVAAAIFWMKAQAGWQDRPAELGKKEQAEVEARTAEKDTGWDGLIGGNVTAIKRK